MGDRVELPLARVTDHPRMIGVAVIELDRQSPTNAAALARWIARNRPDVLRTAWTAGRVHVAGQFSDRNPAIRDAFGWGEQIINSLPDNLRRYAVGIAEYSSDPAEWEWATLRSIERDLREAMQQTFGSSGEPAHQCTDRHPVCLCRSTGSLRPCTQDAWGGERGTISGLLREPLTDADGQVLR